MCFHRGKGKKKEWIQSKEKAKVLVCVLFCNIDFFQLVASKENWRGKKNNSALYRAVMLDFLDCIVYKFPFVHILPRKIQYLLPSLKSTRPSIKLLCLTYSSENEFCPHTLSLPTFASHHKLFSESLALI